MTAASSESLPLTTTSLLLTTTATASNTKKGPRDVVIDVSWVIGMFFLKYHIFFIILLTTFLGTITSTMTTKYRNDDDHVRPPPIAHHHSRCWITGATSPTTTRNRCCHWIDGQMRGSRRNRYFFFPSH